MDGGGVSRLLLLHSFDRASGFHLDGDLRNAPRRVVFRDASSLAPLGLRLRQPPLHSRRGPKALGSTGK